MPHPTSLLFRIARLGVAALALAVGAGIGARLALANEAPLRLVNQTDYETSDLAPVLTSIAPELRTQIRARGLSVFILARHFYFREGGGTCFVVVGLTHPALVNGNARLPAQMFPAAAEYDPSPAFNPSECIATRIHEAIDAMSADPAQALAAIELTAPHSAKPAAGAPTTDARIAAPHLTAAETKAVQHVLDEEQFARVFDNRKVEWSITPWSVMLPSGAQVCVAIAGVSGRPPGDRTNRIPFSVTSSMRFLAPNSAGECVAPVAVDATRRELHKMWTEGARFLVAENALDRQER